MALHVGEIAVLLWRLLLSDSLKFEFLHSPERDDSSLWRDGSSMWKMTQARAEMSQLVSLKNMILEMTERDGSKTMGDGSTVSETARSSRR